MIRSLYTSATGMKANQLYVDNIANNLSNVNTSGYKKSKLEFQDLLYQTMVAPGMAPQEGARSPASLQVGLGVRTMANQKIFMQGNLQETKNPFDLAVSGSGFFQVSMPNGEIAYTRDGAFKLSADGELVTSSGYSIEPSIVVPEGSNEVVIDPQGRVSTLNRESGQYEEIGQMELAYFQNEGGLKSLGGNLYGETPASGQPMINLPGMEGLGMVSQGFIEASNVEMVEEMVNMIVAQRAYEISSKAIKTSDDMLQTANQLKN